MKSRRPSPDVAAIIAETPTIKRALRAAGVPAADLPDLVQVALVGLWQAFERSSKVGALQGLAWIIAQRTARDWFDVQRFRERGRVERAEWADVEGPDPHDRLNAAFELAALREATTAERWRVLLAFAEGVDVADIAVEEGVPVGTVYNWIRLARIDLVRSRKR